MASTRWYFRTGDRARVLADGNLAFVARADRQVKVRGHRVELEEVEAALLSLASVEEAAVFTVPDGEGSSALRAAVVAGAHPPSDREVLSDLRRILPPYALPSTIAFVESMPRTPTGKVDVQALLARETTGQTSAQAETQTQIQTQIQTKRHDGE